MREIDPATFEVVKNALYCAAEEMKVVLAKTAYSPLLKVAGDYSCGLFDVRGEMVAQGPDLPIHLGSMPLAVKAVIQAATTFEPGDVFIHNDPYFGGSHLPDVNVVTPAFHEGTLLGFACVRAHWPDIGSATFEDFCDGDGILDNGDKEDRPFWIRLRVDKRGDRLTVDFDGTDPQVPGPMNAPLNVTASGIYCAIKMIADPGDLVPPNSGCWRPIALVAAPGTVVSAVSPAPVVYANHEISHRVCDMLFGAMAQLVPERVMACSQGTSAILTLGGVDHRTGSRYVSYETIKGGFGARPTKDGITGVASGISNTMNTPIEVLEMSFPVRVERYAIVPDSGGPGRFRGGCGVERVWRILGQPAHASVCLERTKSAPFGLAGGGAGAPGRIAVGGPDGAERELVSKGAFTAAPDAEVRLRAPGSGGYGDPAARDRARLRDDVVNGYVSPAAAAAAYGRGDASELTCPVCRPGSA